MEIKAFARNFRDGFWNFGGVRVLNGLWDLLGLRLLLGTVEGGKRGFDALAAFAATAFCSGFFRRGE